MTCSACGCGTPTLLPDVVRGAVWAVTWTTAPVTDLSPYAPAAVIDDPSDGSRVVPAVALSPDSSYLTISLDATATAGMSAGTHSLILTLDDRVVDRASVLVVTPPGGSL